MDKNEFERALRKLYGMDPEPFQPVVLSERQAAEWRERWEELMESPDAHELRVLGVGDEEHERGKWEWSVRHKLDSALFALANGWAYEWDKPYEYDIPEAPDA